MRAILKLFNREKTPIDEPDLQQLEALEEAIDSNLLKNAVESNDKFFSFEEVIAAHNQAHNVEVRVEDFTK